MMVIALVRGQNSVRRHLNAALRGRFEAPHRMHEGAWWCCSEVACRQSWDEWCATPMGLDISEDDVLAVVRASSDQALLAMRNLGPASLAALRAWASSGPSVANWVGEGVYI